MMGEHVALSYDAQTGARDYSIKRLERQYSPKEQAVRLCNGILDLYKFNGGTSAEAVRSIFDSTESRAHQKISKTDRQFILPYCTGHEWKKLNRREGIHCGIKVAKCSDDAVHATRRLYMFYVIQSKVDPSALIPKLLVATFEVVGVQGWKIPNRSAALKDLGQLKKSHPKNPLARDLDYWIRSYPE